MNESDEFEVVENYLEEFEEVDNPALQSSLEIDRTTIFVQLSHFPIVNDEFICTQSFLEASKGIIVLIDVFGAFGMPMKKDVQGNIDKLTMVYTENTSDHKNLLTMLSKELPRGQGMAIESLYWLRKGLHFFHEFFELLYKDYENRKVKEDLSVYFRKAYDLHLRKHHNWFVQQTFKVLCAMVPNHARLVQDLALGKQNMEPEVYKSMYEFQSHLKNNLNVLEKFYRKHNLD